MARIASGVVVGTAGHIDHGKTTLVHALTGMDTDRLAEEKLRGISIDLGFAHATLPDGREISFIDVPGHERFIKNMLAGAAGIEAVLLVVAADEGVKPQTREHFDICRLLGIKRGVIALTKTDVATAAQAMAAEEGVRKLCSGSFLEHAPVVPVSAVTGEGLKQLTAELSNLPGRNSRTSDTGLPRLPLDRSFALKGFGTVVTGTLWSGQLRVGDMVQIHPTQQTARIRALQVHGAAVDVSTAGQRTAVNLTGIDHREIERGFVLTRPDSFQPALVVDVQVNWLDDSEIPSRRAQFLFHCGTAELSCALKVLSSKAGGEETLARLWLLGPVIAVPGDRFVLRRPSPAHTVAGGCIIDAFPPKRLSRAKAVRRLQSLIPADLTKRIQLLVEESSTGRRIPELVILTGAPADLIESLVLQNRELQFIEAAQRAVTKQWIRHKRESLLEWLKTFHTKNPSIAGAPIAAARLGLDASLASAVFEGFSEIRIQGEAIALASHRAQFTDGETRVLSRIEQVFRTAGTQPPLLAEALKLQGLDAKKSRYLLEVLIKNHRLVRVSDDLVFHADAIAQIRSLLAAHKGRSFSVPEFKDWMQVSRKYAIPLLEYLDRQHVTRRDGDARVVL